MAAEPSAAGGSVQPGTTDDPEQGAAPAVAEPPPEPTLKDKVYNLTEDPDSSFAATCIAGFILLCICCSTACFILETVPALESYTSVWFYAEIFFVSVFTIEYVARFWSTPLPKWRFVIEPFNMVDLLAIAPFYIEMLLPGGALDLRVLRALRLLRLFRLFKVGKYSSNTQLVQLAMSRSTEALVLMVFFMGMAMIFFSTLMYMTEMGTWNDDLGCMVREAKPGECSPFKSIPHSFYWAITTMTTVGYGDVLPTTNLGKLVASCTMVCGILVIALPITMIGNTFVDAHEEITTATYAKNRRAESLSHDKSIRELFDCTQEFTELKDECDAILSKMKQLLASGMVINGDHETAAGALNELNPSYDILHKSHVQSIDDLGAFVKTSLPESFR